VIGRYRIPDRRRAIYHGLVLAGLILLVYTLLVLPRLVEPTGHAFGYDAYAYWTVDFNQPYTQPLGDHGFFPYSPVAALIAQPLTMLTWPQFEIVWWALLFAAVAYLGRRDVLVLLAFPPVAIELYQGNIHLLLAAAIVLGFRYPAAWSFVILTKVTPGIGLVWFAVRREWRRLAIALGFTAALVAITALVMPQQWADWFGVLANNAGAQVNWPALPIPLWLRLPVALVIVVVGARTNRAWTVPLASMLALPVLWVAGLAMLIGCWPLLRSGQPAPTEDQADAEAVEPAPSGNELAGSPALAGRH
jgi:hypothetical protein